MFFSFVFFFFFFCIFIFAFFFCTFAFSFSLLGALEGGAHYDNRHTMTIGIAILCEGLSDGDRVRSYI